MLVVGLSTTREVHVGVLNELLSVVLEIRFYVVSLFYIGVYCFYFVYS